MRRLLGIVFATAGGLIVAGLLLSSPAAASPGPALASLGSNAPDLTPADNGWTAALALTNLTLSPINVTVAPSESVAAGCTLTPTPEMLPAAQLSNVTVTIPDPCRVDTGFTFGVVVSAGQARQTLTVHAVKPTTTPVDWNQLRVFSVGLPIALLVAAVAAGAVLAVPKTKPDGRLGNLPHLASSWSFSGSWLSNVTAGAGLLTGIIGTSTVAKSILGTDADTKLRLATVGAAIALALIAAAPLILGVFQPASGEITIVGLFLAAATSLVAAGGELWIMGQTAEGLSVPWLSAHSREVAVGAMALVVVYGIVALYGTVRSGLVAPKPAPDSDTLKVAKLLAKAIKDARSRNANVELVAGEASDASLENALATADEHTQTIVHALATHPTAPSGRRSALL